MMKLWTLALVAVLAIGHPDAEARRMGSGKSMGQQSSNVTQRDAARPNTPTTPAQNAAPANAARPGAVATPAAAAKKPWGAMLGGLAAGLGLAWLANSLGLGEAFANMLLFGLLAMAVMVVIGMVMRARQNKKKSQANTMASPFAFQGAASGTGHSSPAQVSMPPQYNPEKVGNDASARPWEQTGAAFGGASGSQIGSGLNDASTWSVPADFDAAGFVEAAKRNFVALQAAWDRSDISVLRSMMTDEMLEEIRGQLQERENQGQDEPNQTDVVMLEAQLLGIEEVGEHYMASIEFSGMIREDSNGPSPFREVWNMTKSKSGHSGWLVAGLQALQ